LFKFLHKVVIQKKLIHLQVLEHGQVELAGQAEMSLFLLSVVAAELDKEKLEAAEAEE
jgi:hypothetical protein